MNSRPLVYYLLYIISIITLYIDHKNMGYKIMNKLFKNVTYLLLTNWYKMNIMVTPNENTDSLLSFLIKSL